MTDMLIKCDRFKCTVVPQTNVGIAWMKRKICTIADSNIAVIDAEAVKDFESYLDEDGITYRRC
jgi:hypothetical protein